MSGTMTWAGFDVHVRSTHGATAEEELDQGAGIAGEGSSPFSSSAGKSVRRASRSCNGLDVVSMRQSRHLSATRAVGVRRSSA